MTKDEEGTPIHIPARPVIEMMFSNVWDHKLTVQEAIKYLAGMLPKELRGELEDR
ncbi:MAG: hypothetical protein WCF23_16520 [Candidatus Nitrosopolaris sp.]